MAILTVSQISLFKRKVALMGMDKLFISVTVQNFEFTVSAVIPKWIQ